MVGGVVGESMCVDWRVNGSTLESYACWEPSRRVDGSCGALRDPSREESLVVIVHALWAGGGASLALLLRQ